MSIRNVISMAFATFICCTNVWAMEDVQLSGMREETVGGMREETVGGMREETVGGMERVAPPGMNAGSRNAPPTSQSQFVTLIQRGARLLQENRFREAVATYTQAISANPNSDYAWTARGFALANMGPANYGQAWQDLSRAIELNPRNDSAYLGRVAISKVNHQDYSSDLKIAAQLGNRKAQQMLQNALVGGNAPPAVSTERPMENVTVGPMEDVTVGPMEDVKPQGMAKYQPAPQNSKSNISDEAKRRGKVIDPHGRGLNQAQIDAMEAQRRAMWNATGGGMVYR